MALVPKPEDLFNVSAGKLTSPQSTKNFHWSMRLMSAISLFTLALYTYVYMICRYSARSSNKNHDSIRVKYATLAYSLDVLISIYFSAITPILLERGGIKLDRRKMPAPLFWFFAITGFVPTASMSLTVLGGRAWSEKIRHDQNWRMAHIIAAIAAYFSWWIACLPVFMISLFGEEKTLDWSRKRGLLKPS